MWFFIVKDDEEWIPPLDYVFIKTDLYTDSAFDQYAMCLYHSMLILAGNDIGPRSAPYLFLITLLLFIAAIINASIFGNIAVLLQQMNLKAAKLQEKIEDAHTTMKNLKIPEELQKEVSKYLLYTHFNLEQQNELDLFLSQLSPSLKLHVRNSILKEAISKNVIFEDNGEVITEILMDLSILLFQPETVIIRQGHEGKMMYFIAKGECAIFVSNEKKQEVMVNEMKDGEYFGEVALIKNCKRTATVKSLNYSTCAGYEK